jgi:hypothetical protein
LPSGTRFTLGSALTLGAMTSFGMGKGIAAEKVPVMLERQK